jgi:hypothetical protein
LKTCHENGDEPDLHYSHNLAYRHDQSVPHEDGNEISSDLVT